MPSKKNLRIVSFDGGGVRGLSQLEIMRNIMHRLNWDSTSGESNEGTLPCEHFDLMGGSDTGGLITILFAKLRMSVEEATQEFCTIMEQVYNSDGLPPSERTRRLRKCMEDAMKRKELRLDLPLTEETQPGACSGFVLASTQTNAKSTLSLRTYPVRSHPSSTISVIEAVLATCAIQPEFAPVTSGSGFRLREYIAASRATNLTHEAITEAHLLFGGDSSVVSLLSLGTGHPGTITLASAGGEATLYKIIREMVHDCEEREVEQRIGRVGIYSRLSVEQGMQNDHPGKTADFVWIVTQTEDYLSRHETCEKLDLFEQNFRAQTGIITLDQLKYAGGPTVSSQPTVSVERSLGILISNQDDAIIAKLKPVDLECGSHAPECMEGTRRDILARLDAWAAIIDAPNILWLNGHPGVGKSAIASSLVEKWRSSGRLGSSFFFRRERANVMTPNALWRTVAYDLARRYPTIRKQLIAALNSNETLPSTSNADALFRQLIHEPLMASTMTGAESLPIIVIDALDECGGVDGRHSDHRKALMRALKSWSTLPGRFKLVVSSRGESDIERLFSTTIHHPLEVAAGRKVDYLSSMDIRRFLKHELRQIATQYPLLPSDWPGDGIIERLANRAAGLFIWVKTVIKLLERGEPRRTLKQILDGSGTGGMADLYTWILNTSFPNPSHEDIRDFHSILGAIIFSKAPFDATSLAQLLSIESTTVGYICNGLQSLLDSGNTLQIHHQSFSDFLLDPKECPQESVISRERENRNLTVACLRVMNGHLRFNICDLDSSYLRNSEVPDLASKIENCIPHYLFYSSRFWADHLVQTIFDGGLSELLQWFMQKQFLFWLEVLSLASAVNVASSMLSTLLSWTRASHQDDSLAADMQNSTVLPSMMAVSERYLKHYPQTLAIRRGGQSHWPSIQHILSGHVGPINSVAFSQDGRRIVSGSHDKTVRVWDAETGETVLGPLGGHSSSVSSVSLSSDSRRIVSGSHDKTVRIWDAETGETVLGPLKGHSGWVRTVLFSPDGGRIVSGSDDGTVRLWDTETGETVLGPLEGHIGSVSSVSFSPDGRSIASGSHDKTVRVWNAETGETVLGPLKGTMIGSGASHFHRMVDELPPARTTGWFERIVSGSYDKTVRVWDAETGEAALGPLEGHSGNVYSASFSPDGRRIVSGSQDRSVRVWDAETVALVEGPTEGHSAYVSSVSFSPDGRRIVSGSHDKTVRVWNAETGETVLGPLKGHSDWVRSVSFSPDGRRIVSGSDDGMVRVWDAETGENVLGPLKVHTGDVYSASFSPDGRQIVSGSQDRSVRVWDAETGETVLVPLEGHSGYVYSASSSPDGRRIVSGSHDKRVRVWDSQTGETVLGPLEGHSGSVSSASFSPDGRQIVSGSEDRSVRIWNAEMTQFTDHMFSIFQSSPHTEDGWILGPNSELLFWVPPEIRPRLCPLRNTLVLGGNPTQLDLKNFVHGEAWSRCKDRPA